MRTISLKLSDTLYGDLAAMAEQEGVNRSELIRRVLVDFFQRERPPSRESALARLEDLVGSIEGPGDLSTNPAYLEDLGQKK